MHRSELTVDLGALRRNVRTLLRAADGSQVWAVVKANGYGHGMVDAAGAALGAGATGLCVATIPEGLALRSEFRVERILVLGPSDRFLRYVATVLPTLGEARIMQTTFERLLGASSPAGNDERWLDELATRRRGAHARCRE